jgi:hypothetical protein
MRLRLAKNNVVGSVCVGRGAADGLYNFLLGNSALHPIGSWPHFLDFSSHPAENICPTDTSLIGYFPMAFNCL